MKNRQEDKDCSVLQTGSREICIDTVRVAVRENYDAVKKGEDTATDIKSYLKPEDAKAYYVTNDDYAGDVDLSFE